MIKTIATNHNSYIKISNSQGQYISPYTTTGSVAGAMRFNPNSQTLEVYDGNAWQNVTGHTDISFTDEMIELLNWARDQKNKQKEIERWAKEHTTVAAAWQAAKTAQDQLEVVMVLCREEEKVK